MMRVAFKVSVRFHVRRSCDDVAVAMSQGSVLEWCCIAWSSALASAAIRLSVWPSEEQPGTWLYVFVCTYGVSSIPLHCIAFRCDMHFLHKILAPERAL